MALKARCIIDGPEVHKLLDQMGEEHAIARLRVLPAGGEASES